MIYNWILYFICWLIFLMTEVVFFSQPDYASSQSTEVTPGAGGALQHNIQIIIIITIKGIKIQIDKNEEKQLPQVDRKRWQKVT